MGFCIPSWQRPLVWTRGQEIKFIESAWRGIPLGTYTYNQPRNYVDAKFDGLLIDGQQRMMALQNYMDDAFSVFGLFWSETTEVDKRNFGNRSWHAYVTDSKDEAYLREYYNLMNFGGTVHKESERA